MWRHRWNPIPSARLRVHLGTSYKVPLTSSAEQMDSGHIVRRRFRASVSFLIISLSKCFLILNSPDHRPISRSKTRAYSKLILADIDECSVAKNGGCSHECVNTAGSYKCECHDPELSLSPDNKTCHGNVKLFYNTCNTTIQKLHVW